MRSTFLISWILLVVPNLSCGQTYETTVARRERNLDHWDAETLAAYLSLDPTTGEPLEEDTYVGIDASIMFYAQWCKNCHKFAPVWDTIGQLVHAGTSESNLIMALFNCELNDQHKQLCTAAGVTHYPTLMYVGAGPYVDSDPISNAVLGNKASGPYGRTKLDRTVKFQGNLNIGDSVLDWVKAMRGVSTWHRWNQSGWLKGVRTFFSNPFQRKTPKDATKSSLPVGVPIGYNANAKGGSSGSGGTSAVSTYKLEKELKSVEGKLETAEKKVKDSELASKHAGYLIESFLFPNTVNTTDDEGNVISGEPIDAFAKMTEYDAWDADSASITTDNEEAVILKSCVIDLSLDYCTRLSTKKTTDYIESIKSLPDSEYPSFTAMEAELTELIKGVEPYCANFNKCYKSNFNETDGCRPATCPFNNNYGCLYVSACTTELIKAEYKDALGELAEPAKEETTTKKAGTEADTEAAATASTTATKKQTSGAWGMKK